MRKSPRLLLVMLLLCCTSLLYAQEKIITGVILGDDGAPAMGANIMVKGTNKATQADAQGSFRISAKKGDILEVTSVGFVRREFKVGDDNAVSITLNRSRSELSEVVVAMDIRRNSRELGYSAQGVSGKDVQESQRENLVNGLQGRVAGLTVNPTGGNAGASSQIVLRGFNSLSLNNQPLFVVDGVIIDNSTMNETSNGGTALGLASDRPNRNNDYTNRIADLNPADIASYTVLKGPEATALYGSQAAGGAIIITTKKAGTNRMAVNYDNSFRFQKVTRYAETNDEFGPGSNGVGGSTFSATTGSYFGPRYPANIPRFDNIDNFFRTGFSQTHNLSADFGMKNVGFRLSGSIFNQAGVIPENDYKKYNLRLTNTTKIGKMLEFTPSIQFIHSTNDKPLRSAGGYLLGLYVWPVNNDIRNFTDVNGNKQSIFSTDPYLEIDNPLYNINRNHSYDETDRYIISGGINFNPVDWLSFSGRFGYDTYKSTGYTFYHPLSQLTTRGLLGSQDNYWREYYGYNHTITGTAKKTIGKWSGRVMVGTMWQDYQTEQFAVSGTNLVDSIGSNNQLYRKGQIVTDANFAQLVGNQGDSNITRPATRTRLLQNHFGRNNKYITRQSAYFGEFAISYNNLLFFSYTHRFESASVFAADKRNYNYPGASVSVILSDIFPGMQKGGILDYWKLRSSVAGTARLADPYKNQSVFVNNFASTQTGAYSYSFDNNNPFLEPERQTTFEIGTEIRLLNNLFVLDVDYYNTYCYNQIASQYRASYGTGYILNTANGSSSRNQGVEVVLDVAPVRTKDFSWNVRFNFAHMWSKVISLPASIQQEFYLSDSWLYANARGGITKGGTTTTITGFHYQRNNTGQVLINPTTGLPVVEQTFTVIGDRMPDFTLGTLNTLRYKNWNLSFLWDLKVGGDVFNATEMYLTLQGKSPRTADRETPRVVKGVLMDGLQNTANPTPNTIAVTPFYTSAYYSNTNNIAEEEFVQKDVNYFRLRDITLSYTVPGTLIKKWKFIKSLSLFGTGNDLLLITNYRGADPAVNGNTAGSTGVGAFGFDYGTLPAPISVNFGLRAGF
jgi:TonB-linked SusC/RagA family outer membrane protein